MSAVDSGNDNIPNETTCSDNAINELNKKIIYFKLSIMLLAIASLVWFYITYYPFKTINTKPQPKIYDISKGELSYGHWYQYSKYYRTDVLDSTALLSVNSNGEVKIAFIFPASQCTQYEEEKIQIILQLNNIATNYLSHCFHHGLEMLTANNDQQGNMIIQEFIKSNKVMIIGGRDKSKVIFSAMGFTDAYKFLSDLDKNVSDEEIKLAVN